MWRMAKVAGGIDTTVRLIETVIETVPTFSTQGAQQTEAIESRHHLVGQEF
jgi:hypothetical protein